MFARFFFIIIQARNSSSLVSPLLSLGYRRTATVGSYWRGMGEAPILLGNENKSKLSFAFLSFFYNFVIE